MHAIQYELRNMIKSHKDTREDVLSRYSVQYFCSRFILALNISLLFIQMDKIYNAFRRHFTSKRNQQDISTTCTLQHLPEFDIFIIKYLAIYM